jgi:RNA polymerase sigma factor (sigma-70 family)
MIGLVAQPLLVDRAETGLVHDFAAWMTSEQRRVYSLCQRFLQDRDEADSATQDVFLKAYQALKRDDAQELDDPARWITRIAVNTCLDRLRSRKWQFWRKRPSAEDEQTILSMAASRSPGADDHYFASEIGARLNAAMDKLSPRQRAVGTVKAHMFRAITKLREDLKDLYGKK